MRIIIIIVLTFLVLLITNEVVFSKNNYYFSFESSKIIQPEIDLVSVLEENKCFVNWKINKNNNIKSINIYRSINSTNLNWILLTSTHNLKENIYIDSNINTNENSYKYKVSVLDFCNNEINSISNFSTILLKLDKTKVGLNNLEWNKCDGIDVNQYKIFRGTSLNTMELIDSVSFENTSYLDNFESNENLFYRIEIDFFDNSLDSINKKKIIKSNNLHIIKNSISENSIKDNIQIIPNPIHFESQIIFPYDNNANYRFQVIDILGNILFDFPIFSGNLMFHRGQLADGIYLLRIKKNEFYYTKKFLIGGKSI